MLIGMAGCGDGRPSLVEAKGTVQLDGQPVEGATVLFQPVEVDAEGFKRPATATTDASGNFAMGAYGPGGGVPTGTYSVGIRKRELVGELPPNYNPEMPDAIPLKYKWTVPRAYADPGSSGLTAEVSSSGVEPAVFALDSGGGAPEIEVTGPRRGGNEP
jgi:hypothetical protein